MTTIVLQEEQKQIERIIDRFTKVTLHCGEWYVCIDKPLTGIKHTFSLWHIRNGTRNDMTVNSDSIKQLQFLCKYILEELKLYDA